MSRQIWTFDTDYDQTERMYTTEFLLKLSDSRLNQKFRYAEPSETVTLQVYHYSVEFHSKNAIQMNIEKIPLERISNLSIISSVSTW